ncbi:DUF2911 domain-containing protein [Flavobacterium sp. K77]|uniref:DUF2911 domain-containing protein n=1 Tax=Flavobacterium sp. K77 TaxID=2910676 RepID=UPI001F23C6BA|nr:DUF2911 domain-containing protein [Flavobacterium sp. K77]MCF6141232.1 DUF2911 domain-containing protein [Flavobacterium sp. K77]
MKLLKQIQFAIIGFLLVTVASGQGKPTSTKESVTGKINGATITINYGSPSVNGRAIWGALVPFNQVWRAGANDATTFETDKEITVEGAKLPAGKYSFFVLPSEKESVIIFNKEAKQWGAYKYKQTEDQLRVTIKQKASKKTTEKLVYTVEKNAVVLSWENWDFVVNIK